jgi:hypothetical protein
MIHIEQSKSALRKLRKTLLAGNIATAHSVDT